MKTSPNVAKKQYTKKQLGSIFLSKKLSAGERVEIGTALVLESLFLLELGKGSLEPCCTGCACTSLITHSNREFSAARPVVARVLAILEDAEFTKSDQLTSRGREAAFELHLSLSQCYHLN